MFRPRARRWDGYGMRVLISGGGTGGHLFPAIAVAQALSRKEPDATVLFAGRREGIEARTVASYGMRFAPIPAAPLYTEQVWRNWALPIVLGSAHHPGAGRQPGSASSQPGGGRNLALAARSPRS